MKIFDSFHTLLVLGLACSFLLIGCSSNSVRIDYNSAIDLSKTKTFEVSSVNLEDPISASRLILQTTRILENNGLVPSQEGKVDAIFELDHFMEERPNDSRFSIGLGTGSYGRSGGIGVGGSVDLPLGEDLIPFAVVIVNVIANDTLAWTATHSVEVDPDKSTGFADAQQKALKEIFAKYPFAANTN